MLLSSVLLDSLSAIGYGNAFLALIKWGCIALVTVVLLVGFILVMRPDGESTQQEPIESTQEEPVQMRGEDYFVFIMVVVVVLIVFGTWIF